MGLLAGCSGQIKGTVFLDANANHQPDKAESTLTGVSVKVALDGKPIANTKTDSKGRFLVAGKGPGYYCLEVTDAELGTQILSKLSAGSLSSASLSQTAPKIGIGPSVSVVSKQLYGDTSIPVCGNNKMEGDEECDDGNRADGDGCSSTCKNQLKPEESAPPTAQPDIRDAGRVCRTIDAFNLTAHIPVVLNYQADISDLPPPSKQTHTTGEDFLLTIIHPIGCVLEPLYVQDVLEIHWDDAMERRDPNIASIDPQTGRVGFQGRVISRSVTVPMRVKDNLSFGTHSAVLSPKAKCPDGSIVTLHPIEMDLVVKPNLEVEQRGLPSAVRAGETVIWEVTVKNKEKREYRDITLVLVPSSDFSFSAPPHGCSNAGGGGFECPIVRLGGLASSVPVRFHLTSPGNITAEIRSFFNASVKIPDYEEDISAEEAGLVVGP
ncbi:MAG: myxococcus cysteine-rich repeat containing protein [Deltaproteobacteria bacterium]|nr:myxococcus cysteine-rich repeat containing protein [Deltaproteobacteria bacterium]